jgi:hypothetical protein
MIGFPACSTGSAAKGSRTNGRHDRSAGRRNAILGYECGEIRERPYDSFPRLLPVEDFFGFGG